MLKREALRKALDEGPRSAEGDPAFAALEEVLLFFDEEDLVALVNIALYHKDYQRLYHRKRAEVFKELRAKERVRQALERAELPAHEKKALAVTARRLRKEVDEDLGPEGRFACKTSWLFRHRLMRTRWRRRAG